MIEYTALTNEQYQDMKDALGDGLKVDVSADEGLSGNPVSSITLHR